MSACLVQGSGKSYTLSFVLYLFGGALIALAMASYFTNERMAELLLSLQKLFGWSYSVIYCVLVTLSTYAWRQLSDVARRKYWLEVGLQAAGGIATLSLTFTLLGISLGIGSLSEKVISPETIQEIIQTLTGYFATAFMTTVVGLPTANILRSALAVRNVRLELLKS